MQAINSKTTEQIKMFLEEVAADMEILVYNVRESNESEDVKDSNIKLIKQLSQGIYDTAEKLK